jgi:hypothetical protein
LLLPALQLLEIIFTFFTLKVCPELLPVALLLPPTLPDALAPLVLALPDAPALGLLEPIALEPDPLPGVPVMRT